jgi:hypothetical protein
MNSQLQEFMISTILKSISCLWYKALLSYLGSSQCSIGKLVKICTSACSFHISTLRLKSGMTAPVNMHPGRKCYIHSSVSFHFSLFSKNILQVDKPGCGNGQYEYRVRLHVQNCTSQNTSNYMYKTTWIYH